MAKSSSKNQQGEDEEVEDYMTMAIVEPEKHESSLQRARRLRQEAAERGRPKSKAEREAEEREARETGLAKPVELPKKRKLLQSVGFDVDDRGKATTSRKWEDPITLKMKQGKGGIGEEERIRQKTQGTAGTAKKEQITVEEFRSRMGKEQKNKEKEAKIRQAAAIAEEKEAENEGKERAFTKEHLKNIPLVLRSYVRERLEKERDLLARAQSLHDRKTNNGALWHAEGVEEELEEDDEELQEYNSLPPEQRLKDITRYLRDKHYYCFWCCSSDLENCPGTTEEDHD